MASSAQIPKLSAAADILAAQQQSIQFRLLKDLNTTSLIWNNYYSSSVLSDTAYYDLGNIKVVARIEYPGMPDMIMEPYLIKQFSNHSYDCEKVVILPYKTFKIGMIFSILLVDTVINRTMEISVHVDELDVETLSDRLFCFNYIPFKEGVFCFKGRDIQHWDVATATVNPTNSWMSFSRTEKVQ